jgi:hypothetical protein
MSGMKFTLPELAYFIAAGPLCRRSGASGADDEAFKDLTS